MTYRRHLLATSMLVSGSLLAVPAYGQVSSPSGAADAQAVSSSAPESDAGSSGGDIVVTGSRIPQPNLESSAPVTVVSNEDLKLSGTSRIEDVLNQLPSVGAAQSSGISNASTGTAEVDLRYLGSKRTLSLVNGRRLMPGDPAGRTQAADLNVIPSALVKRVDVLTGGASSVYGADAVAGVVNFIMDTDFEGVRFDGNFSIWQHRQDNPSVSGGLGVDDVLSARDFAIPTGSTSDGRSIDGTVTIGAGFDDGRGHVVAFFGYRNVKPVLEADRDFSACVIQNTSSGVPRCGGSATAAPGTGVIFAPTPDGTIASTVAALAPGTITPFEQNLYNYAPLNYFQRPDERYIFGAFGNYEVNQALKPYLEFMAMDDRTLAQIAPSGDFGNTLTINCDNPLMSAQQRSIICAAPNLINGFLGNFPLASGASYNPNPGAPPVDFIDPSTGATYQQAFFQLLRRNIEGGPRISDLRHQSWRGVVGARGDLSNVFSYDTYFQYGRTNYTQVFKNEFSAARLRRALDVIDDPRTAAVDPICRSLFDGSDASCVPYDPFGAAPSAASVNYLNVFGVMQGITSEQIANFNVTGLLGEAGVRTPWAEDGVGINAGLEYRRESLELNPDQAFQAGDLTGQGGSTLPVSGSFRAWEVFAETQIPIIEKSFIDELSFSAGYRKSWYNTSGGTKYGTDTYKLSLEFAPVPDLRFRAAYNRAARAPNIQELFAPQFVGLDGSNDLCAGPVIGATDFGCIATGLAAGRSTPANPASQYNGLLGGNPNLKPEKATTTTLGVVLQPRFVPHLALTLDYWTIKVADAIQGFGADAVIAACVHQSSSASDISPACSLIHRDPGGSLWLTSSGFVEDIPNNVSKIKTSGIDLNGSYSHRLFGLGKMSWSFVGTYLDKYRNDNGLSEPYDCAGYYGPVCSGGRVAASAPMPRWRHKLRASLNTPLGLGASLQWRRIGKVRAETLQDNETVGGENTFDPGLHIKAQNYLDLAGTYAPIDRLHLRFGINNLLDNDPPLVAGGHSLKPGSNLCPVGPCNGNTYPGTWDSLGRFLFVGATLDFLPPRPAPTPIEPVAPPPPPPPPPATQTCADGSVVLASESCPAPPPPPPPAPAAERG